ncbi:MAG: tetratricopeptide repeat protein [bacterium]|nr:tetratricopeptide repeat protein [bacterium]
MMKRVAVFLMAAGFLLAGVPGTPAHQDSKSFLQPKDKVARPAGYDRVIAHLRAWDVAAARRVLEDLRVENPGAPEWDALEGTAAYLEGRYQKSIELLNLALRKRPGDREWLELRLHVRQTQSAVAGFNVHRTAHFEIHHDPGVDAILVPYLAEALEAAHEIFPKKLGVSGDDVVRIEIFSDPVRFHKASTLSRRDIEVKGAVGISKFNKLMMISPGALIRGYRWLDTAVHEYVHYLIVRATHNRAPIWLHEGIAHYLEKKWRKSDDHYLTPSERMLLAGARERGTYIPFKKMEPSLIYLESSAQVQLAYAEAATAADFIERRIGPRGLARLLRAIRDEKPKAASPPGQAGRGSLVELESSGAAQSAESGLHALFRVGLAGFEKIWRKDLENMPLKVPAGVQVHQFLLKPTGPVDESASEMAALQSATARRRMRLGDRLLFGGRLRAAWTEYGRALEDEPNSPVLLNRLARVALRLEAPDEALPYILRARRIDPDGGATYIHLGIAHEMRKDFPAARDAWKEAIQINPFHPLPHERLAFIYAREGRKKEAEQERKVFQSLRN